MTPARISRPTPFGPRLWRTAAVGLTIAALSSSCLAQPEPKTKAKPDQPARPAAAPASTKPQGVTVTLNAEQRAMLYRALAASEQEGFAPNAFAPANLGALLNSRDKDEIVRGQDLLVAGVIRYAKAQHGLRGFQGGDWPKEWALRPQPYDAERDFSFAVQQNKVAEWLNSLPPPFARYRALKAALAVLRAPAPEASPAPAETGKTVAKGKAKGSRSAKAAKATPKPKDELSRDEKINAVLASMERWRWVPRNLPADRIEVNSAGGTLQTFQGGKPTLAMKVAAGKPGDETPVLSSAIDEIVFNPVWHVPKSIATEELYPKNKRNPGYFKREGFESSKTSESGLIQKPGPKNALGQIKFDFKNPFAVYLHDTPAQSAFERSDRNVSHGCVRVENPSALASLLLQGTPEGDPQVIQQLIAPSPDPDQSPETRTAKVPRPMPVYLLYFTAFAGDDGSVQFRKDVYGWDTMLLQLLAAGQGAA